jgi:hypothetical protein
MQRCRQIAKLFASEGTGPMATMGSSVVIRWMPSPGGFDTEASRGDPAFGFAASAAPLTFFADEFVLSPKVSQTAMEHA